MELVARRSTRASLSTDKNSDFIFPPASDDYKKNYQVVLDACNRILEGVKAMDVLKSIEKYSHGLKALQLELNVQFESKHENISYSIEMGREGAVALLGFYRELYSHTTILKFLNAEAVKNHCMEMFLDIGVDDKLLSEIDDVLKVFDGYSKMEEVGKMGYNYDQIGSNKYAHTIIARLSSEEVFGMSYFLSRVENKANYRIFVNNFSKLEKLVSSYFNKEHLKRLQHLNEVLGKLYENLSPCIAVLRLTK